MTQGNIYFDFNATTPIDPLVVEKIPQWITLWGNPSSIHQQGRGPKKLLRESRRMLAQVLNCQPLEIIFTSGGSESNNTAIQGTLKEIRLQKPTKNKVILGSIEHPSVLSQISEIEALGFEVIQIPMTEFGFYDLNFYQQSLSESVALVSVMLANNEVGLIAPIKEMAQKAHLVGALFHSDLVQALGKVPVDLKDLDIDLASFSGHKVYALKGIGALYVKKGTPFRSLIQGGSQERYRRAGTENLLSIASFALMAEKLSAPDFIQNIKPLRDHLEAELKRKISGVRILCEQHQRLANTSSFYIDGVSGESLLMNLDIRGFSVSTGAACSSGNPEPSPVLLAMGLTYQQAQSSLRVSFGKDTNLNEVNLFIEVLTEIVHHLRNLNSQGVSNAAVI